MLTRTWMLPPVAGLCLALTSMAMGDVLNMGPDPTPQGHLRIMAWNIEFLNTRSPPRTPEQLDLLTQRIAGFDAAVMALQEISQRWVLRDIAADLGPTWRVVTTPGQGEALLYDESKVSLLSGGTLHNLDEPPQTSYPGDPWRKPISGVFVPAGGGEAFRVIGVHLQWNSGTIREAQGQWLHDRVVELLDTPDEPEDIFVVGDYNSEPRSMPHRWLAEGGVLVVLRSRVWGTSVLGAGDIDHCAVTEGALQRIPEPWRVVIRAGDYGETPEEFEAVYSDHYPIFVDVLVPEPLAISLLAVGGSALLSRRR